MCIDKFKVISIFNLNNCNKMFDNIAIHVGSNLILIIMTKHIFELEALYFYYLQFVQAATKL